MFVSEAREVDADGNAIGDAPSAADHDSVGVMRSAKTSAAMGSPAPEKRNSSRV